jgi:hypothetical protein
MRRARTGTSRGSAQVCDESVGIRRSPGIREKFAPDLVRNRLNQDRSASSGMQLAFGSPFLGQFDANDAHGAAWLRFP